MRVVDVLAAIRSPQFDLPLTYDAGDRKLEIGDVVRVALGSREVLAFVVSPIRDVPATDVSLPKSIKPILERIDVPRAFDAVGLNLAAFMAEYYVCTLGEALSAVMLGGALPHMRDTFERAVTELQARRLPSVPPRLLRLIWQELPDDFTLEQLLHHPEARRAGDRAALLRFVRSLVRAGTLRRKRRLVDPRVREYTIRVLESTGNTVVAKLGKRSEALVAFVRDRSGTVPRADALLAGFGSALIARALRAGALVEREVRPQRVRNVRSAAEPPVATAEQRVALDRIEQALANRAFETMLLHGVTGSGKTYVYVEAIKNVVRDGGRAIVLVPEISLTPQATQRFVAAFGERVAVLHSALSERERFEAWQACARGEIDVVVGARSAVFAPLRDVRLLVVDEAHDPSYKQEQVPRYHAATVALERMRYQGGILLLGSATPSMETYAAAEAGKIPLLRLRERATQLPLPNVRVVDLTTEFESGNRGIFSTALVQALGERLARGEKTVLFVNRRGSAACVLCRSCGAVPQCPRCSVALAAHRSEALLRCHYCDYQAPIPRRCPGCGMETIREFGLGTERVADEVARLFPAARVIRMDSDTTTRVGDHARILRAFEEGGDVLVGTQMVAKGLDFPTVTLVGVVAADLGLHVPDFRASERSFALIMQVCGRSGRARPGEAIVQTYVPAHPAIVSAATHDYEGFAGQELRERRTLGFPPDQRLIELGVIGRSRARTAEAAARYARILRESGVDDVLGPAPYPIARVNNEWRFRIALKTRKAGRLKKLIRDRLLPLAGRDPSTRLRINVDP